MREPRAIDAYALGGLVFESKNDNPHSDGIARTIHNHEHEHFLKMICLSPTIDAVPVVRCAECERRSKSADLTDTVYCPWLKQQMRKTDFCSYGERKDGE